MPTAIHKKVRECRAGTHSQAICKLQSGWLVMGDVQFLEGYCLILADPVVDDLNAMDTETRAIFHKEIGLVGDALLAVTKAKRINYEILGNLEPALHGHIFPRYANETEELRTKPVWFYDWDNARSFDLDTDTPLMDKIRNYLIQHNIISAD